jgi:hypothetical protein
VKRTIPRLIYCITDTRQRDQREDNILAHFLNLIDSMFENLMVDAIPVVDLNDVLPAISGYTTTHKLVSWEDAVRTSHPRSESDRQQGQGSLQNASPTANRPFAETGRRLDRENPVFRAIAQAPRQQCVPRRRRKQESRDQETRVQRRVTIPQMHLLPEPRSSHQGDPRLLGSSRQVNPSEIAKLQLLCQAGQPHRTCFPNKVPIHKAPDVTGDLLQVQETWTLHVPTSVRLPHRRIKDPSCWSHLGEMPEANKEDIKAGNLKLEISKFPRMANSPSDHLNADPSLTLLI